MTQPVATHFERIDALADKKGSPFRILIVDDEPWVRNVFRDICSLTSNFKVDLAVGGQEAIDKAGRQDYDLITIDLIMPEVSGLEAIQAIKETCPRVPVMVITGNATDRLVRQAGIFGACKVIYKPVVMNELVAELADALARQSKVQ